MGKHQVISTTTLNAAWRLMTLGASGWLIERLLGGVKEARLRAALERAGRPNTVAFQLFLEANPEYALMPMRTQGVMRRRRILSMPPAELAEITGLDIETVRVRVAAIREAIRGPAKTKRPAKAKARQRGPYSKVPEGAIEDAMAVVESSQPYAPFAVAPVARQYACRPVSLNAALRARGCSPSAQRQANLAAALEQIEAARNEGLTFGEACRRVAPPETWADKGERLRLKQRLAQALTRRKKAARKAAQHQDALRAS